MLVKDWMTEKVVTIGVQDTLQKATELMMDHQISMLPVLENGRLVGIVTDRDLRAASPSDVTLLDVRQILYHLTRVEMRAIMSRDPITLPPEFTVEEAAEVMLKNKISGCPVVDKTGNLIGVITKNDLFRAMVAVSGLSGRGVEFGVVLEDRPGSIKEAADVVRAHGGRIVSILSSFEKAPAGHRCVYLRVFNLDRQAIPKVMEELRKNGKILYLVDFKENKREILEAL